MSATKVHIAGLLDGSGVQRCLLCWAILADYRDTMVPEGTPPLRGFEPGGWVVVEAPAQYVVREVGDGTGRDWCATTAPPAGAHCDAPHHAQTGCCNECPPPPASAQEPTAAQREAAEALVAAVSGPIRTGDWSDRAVAELILTVLIEREAAARREGAEGMRGRTLEAVAAAETSFTTTADPWPYDGYTPEDAAREAAASVREDAARRLRALPLEDPT